MTEELFLELREHPGYFISNMGRVRKGKSKMLAIHQTKKGYCIFSIFQDGVRKYYSVHRLVAEYFIGPLEGKEVNHKNFIKIDNRAENLEIVTRLENMRHFHSDERAKATYEKIGLSKIKEVKAPRVYKKYEKKPVTQESELPNIFNVTTLARHLGVSHQRASWMLAHLDDGQNRERLKSAMRAALLEMKNEIETLLNQK